MLLVGRTQTCTFTRGYCISLHVLNVTCHQLAYCVGTTAVVRHDDELMMMMTMLMSE